MKLPPYLALAVLGLLIAAGGCKTKIAGGRADGAKIFAEVCAKCHGPDGSPSAAMRRSIRVKDLTDPALQTRLSDAQIRKQVANGSANRLMPAFGDSLNEAQMDAIVKYVRTLGKKAE